MALLKPENRDEFEQKVTKVRKRTLYGETSIHLVGESFQRVFRAYVPVFVSFVSLCSNSIFLFEVNAALAQQRPFQACMTIVML